MEMPGSILIYFPCISKSITFPLSRLVQQLIENGHEVKENYINQLIVDHF